jgi:hypothetical protein
MNNITVVNAPAGQHVLFAAANPPVGGVYNAIEMQVSDPPRALNIKSKIFNKIEKTLAARQAAQASLILSNQAVSVVIAGGVQASLPPQDNLINFLDNGEWGRAFIGLVQGIQTPIPITEDTIKSIFTWGDSIGSNPDPAVKVEYRNIIIKLLKLPSGIGLIRDIIITHHCMVGLPKMEFTFMPRTNTRFQWYSFPKRCTINLKWDGANSRYANDEYTLIAKNNALPAPTAAHLGSQLDFINVPIPPCVGLAHELNHYLSELLAHKKHAEIGIPGVVAEAVTTPEDESVLAFIQANTLTKDSTISAATKIDIEQQYKKILEGIVPPGPLNALSAAQKVFVKLWNHLKYEELLNILPSENILKNGNSEYNDGVIIGEAILQGTIVIPPVAGQAVTYAGLTRESFVRFSHQDSAGFNQYFNALSVAEKGEFRDLVQLLLNKIIIPVPLPVGFIGPVAMQPLSAANNNLPRF